MITRLVRRICEGSVVLFAALGFFHVQLGKHTGSEHLQAILATPPAREALGELVTAALSIKDRVLGFGTASAEPARPKPRHDARRTGLSKPAPLRSRELSRSPADAGTDASITWHSP